MRRDEYRRLRRIEEGLAANDRDYVRRLRGESERLADAPTEAVTEPVPWAAVALVWGAVLVAALLLILTSALTA